MTALVYALSDLKTLRSPPPVGDMSGVVDRNCTGTWDGRWSHHNHGILIHDGLRSIAYCSNDVFAADMHSAVRCPALRCNFTDTELTRVSQHNTRNKRP